MRILINLATLKSGGGQNVGLNLIKGINNLNICTRDLLFLAASGTKIAAELDMYGYQTIYISVDPKVRILQEWLLTNRLMRLKIDIVYSVFGYANIRKNILQVCGIADSNLFYPEVKFWQEYKGVKKFYKKLIDHYRLTGYLSAAGLVFENEDMHKRYLEKYPNKNLTTFIKPSFVLESDNDDKPLKIDIKQEKHIGLFLCGWQFNKGIMKIPKILKIAQENSFGLEIIITTKLDKSIACKAFIKECKKEGIEKFVHLIGKIDKKHLKGLYQVVDYVFLLSKLESFSNNIIEAWNYKKLLVISDYNWARSICGNAALYVNREDATDILHKIRTCKRKTPMYDEIVSRGYLELEKYPNIEQRTKQEIDFLREVYESIS